VATDDYAELQAAVLQTLGLDLRLYKREQMERRLRAYGQQRGFPDLRALSAALRADRALPSQLMSYLTIHVSEFFRDPAFFSDLRSLLRELPQVPRPLRAWSAGCSIGAEAYTVAMLLQEERPLQHQVLGTDVDEQSLEKARLGIYREEEIRQVDAQRRSRYFTAEEGAFRVRPDLQRQVTFRRHDLLRDPYPQGQDLILFRNVAIYFTEEAKEKVLRAFAEALSPKGILMVGSTEPILRPQAVGLRQVRPFFFTRE
jgi:chemotaxis protein methyltransferase CheR